jgi:uncharacterized RDD family membrane protein YckC
MTNVQRDSQPEYSVPIDELGGFWIRAFAYVIDVFFATFAGMVMSVIWKVTEAVMHYHSPEWIAPTLSVCLTVTYLTAFQALFEGTLGKRAMGLRLVSQTFEPLTVSQGFYRYLMFILGSLPLGLGYFSIGWNTHKQGWHDRIVGTLVVRKSYLDRVRGGAEGPIPVPLPGSSDRGSLNQPLVVKARVDDKAS